MPNPDNLIGKGFDAHPEHINKGGRPKKWVSELLDEGYKKAEINDCYSTLLAQTEAKLKEIRDNPDLDILIRKTAKALLKEWDKGTMYNQEVIITRLHGQPKQEIEAQVNITKFDVKFNDTKDGKENV